MLETKNAIIPFEAEISQTAIVDLRDRLANTRWTDAETVNDWSQGVPIDYLRELCSYWATDYDMGRLPERLNAFNQVVTTIDDVDIHALHVRSPIEGAQPLLMTHGWPGSVVEFLDVIGPLTDPEAFGGDRADAFHVVCPSLPGYGFSGKPTTPGWGLDRIAETWLELMTRLGYDEFVTQGGDWGSNVANKVAQLRPDRVKGVHLNIAVASPEALMALGDVTPFEEELLGRFKYYADNEAGYSTIQSTRPQTIGYGLTDSPVAQCAWVVEKLHAWTDCDGHPENAISRDVILDNVSLYWFTGTGTSSARLYWESFASTLTDLPPVHVPVGYTVFPKDLFALSERWARTRFSDLRHYSVADRGGHFASLEQPEIFVDEVRRTFRAVRRS
jgi:epoxide hydrolase